MTDRPSDPAAAYACAVDMLSRQDRSEKDLYERLIKKGFEEVPSRAAVIKLKEMHYLDDERLAYNYISSRLAAYSLTQLRYKLRQKGVDSSAIDNAFNRIKEDSEELGENTYQMQARAVCDFLRKKKCGPVPEEKVLASLYRKGFSYEAIKAGVILYEQETAEE